MRQDSVLSCTKMPCHASRFVVIHEQSTWPSGVLAIQIWYNTLYRTASAVCNRLHHTASCSCRTCDSMHDCACDCMSTSPCVSCSTNQHSATLCDTLQHTATHCNTLISVRGINRTLLWQYKSRSALIRLSLPSVFLSKNHKPRVENQKPNK